MVSKEEFSKLLWAKDFVTIQRGHQLGKHFLHSAHKNVVNKEEFSKLLSAKDFITIQRGQQLGKHECIWATHHSTNI